MKGPGKTGAFLMGILLSIVITWFDRSFARIRNCGRYGIPMFLVFLFKKVVQFVANLV